MAHCCENEGPQLIFEMCFGTEGYWLVASIFITGLIFSFTHCIGMCGPIATAQLSSRLIELDANSFSQKQRIKIALLLPYYLGKGVTYIFFAVASYLIAENIADNYYTKNAAIFIMAMAGLFFLGNAFKYWLKLPWPQAIDKVLSIVQIKLANIISFRQGNTYGLKGFILGIMLGFIPCGILYSCIIMIASLANNVLIAALSAAAFALASIPGLFIISYFGSYIISKWKTAFAVLNSCIMLFNSYLMFSYLHYIAS